MVRVIMTTGAKREETKSPSPSKASVSFRYFNHPMISIFYLEHGASRGEPKVRGGLVGRGPTFARAGLWTAVSTFLSPSPVRTVRPLTTNCVTRLDGRNNNQQLLIIN